MFRLPILPEIIRIPLDECKIGNTVVGSYPGVTAVVRPLGLEEESKWHDAFPDADHKSQAATWLVLQQLVTLEGLEVVLPSGAGVVQFDPKDPLHQRALPMAIRSAIYLALVSRASVSEELEKNSDLPSASDGTSDTESSSAETALSESATS